MNTVSNYNDSKELCILLNTVLYKSNTGEIPWVQTNPSTVTWLSSGIKGGNRLTIQKVTNKRVDSGTVTVSEYYILQLDNILSMNNLLTINSSIAKEYQDVLGQIHLSATRTASNAAIDSLKEMLNFTQ